MAEAAQEHPARPWLLLSPALVSIVFLLLIPALFVFVYSFWLRTATGADVPELNLGNWQEIFGDEFYRLILWQTFRIAAITTLVCALMGYVPAYFLAHTRIEQKAYLLLMLMLPFWISYIIRTLSWPFQMLYNEASVVLGLVHYLLPFMILNVYVSLDGIDKNLEPAARTLGCTPWQAFLEVTLPLSLPGR